MVQAPVSGQSKALKGIELFLANTKKRVRGERTVVEDE